MSGQIRCQVLDEPSAAVRIAGRLLAEAILGDLKEKPGCACGSIASTARTRVEMVGTCIAVDLHLRCNDCA